MVTAMALTLLADGPHCTLARREVTSCDELVNDDKVWLVPPRREFMWPTFERGHKVEVWHVETANQRPIVVETLSDKPKVRPCLYINGVAGLLICGLGPVLTGALPLARRGRCTVVLVCVCVVQLFHLHNFFSEEEADQLIANALKISDPLDRLQPSTVGEGPGARVARLDRRSRPHHHYRKPLTPCYFRSPA
jgi:hypothetical protein